MKRIFWYVGLMVLLGFVQRAGATTGECWKMDDPAGTSFAGLRNSGSLGSSWDWNMKGVRTDGSGHLVIHGGVGVFTRKVPRKSDYTALPGKSQYAKPLGGSNTTCILEIKFSEWKFGPTATGDSLIYKVMDSQNRPLASISLKKTSPTSVKISLSYSGGNYKAFDYSCEEKRELPVRIELDYANHTVKYYVNETCWNVFHEFSGDKVASIAFVLIGNWENPENLVKIDEMALWVKPSVPATPTTESKPQ